MTNKINIKKDRWKANKPSNYKINQLDYMGFDGSIKVVNHRLKNTSCISSFKYDSIDNRIKKANELLEQLCYYINATLEDINDQIDEPFFEYFDNRVGILEKFEKINLDDYKTKNNLGIKEHGSYSYNDYYTKMIKKVDYSYEKDKIGFKDILNNSELQGYKGMPSFAKMMKDQYNTAVVNDNIDLDFDNYVDSLLHRADIHHTVDRGWLNFLSDALDTIGIVSAVAIFTGENFITNEILTKKERERALIDTVVNVTLLATTILTAGAGSIAAVGTKAALKQTAKNIATSLAVDMISGVSGLATINILDSAGAPEWFTMLAGLGVSFTAGYYGNKKFVDVKPVNQRGTSYLENLDDFVKGNKNFDDVVDDFAIAYANKVNSNKRWKWRDIPGTERLSDVQISQIRDLAKQQGYLPNIPKKPGTNYPDFEKGNVIYKIDGKPVIEILPEDKWLLRDKKQYEYLDSKLPGGIRPEGYTWHHSEIEGRMELVPYGIHNTINHKGGRAPGGWADAKR